MSNTIAEFIREHLQEHGPCTEGELHAALVQAGRTSAKTPAGVRSSLQGSSLTVQRPDGRWELLIGRLAGAVLTVRPRALLHDDTLWVHADLEPFLMCGTRLPLTTGGSVRSGGTDVRTLIGPPGWLPDVQPGELLALRWDGRALSVSVLAQNPDDERVRRARGLLRLHALAAAQLKYGGPPRWASVVLSALKEDPSLLAEPLLPLSELLPFEEDLSADTGVWENHRAGHRLTLHLPERVYGELLRRSEQLGDRLPDYAGMLLGAAVDRLAPRSFECSCSSSSYRYDTWSEYPDEPPYELGNAADVLPLR